MLNSITFVLKSIIIAVLQILEIMLQTFRSWNSVLLEILCEDGHLGFVCVCTRACEWKREGGERDFKSEVLRNIFGLGRDYVANHWRKSNKELLQLILLDWLKKKAGLVM